MALYADSALAVISSVDWVPAAPRTVTTALMCLSSGTAYVDWLGVQPGQPGATNDPIPMVTGQILDIAIIKIHHTSSTGTYRALY